MTDYIVESHGGYSTDAAKHLNDKEKARPGYELVSVALSDAHWIYVWRKNQLAPNAFLQVGGAARNLMQASLAYQSTTAAHQEVQARAKPDSDVLSQSIIDMTAAYNRLVNATNVMEAVLKVHG